MIRASDVEGEALKGPDGSVLGTLEKLLLHPDGTAVVVGATVRPPAALVVVGRRQTYVPLSALEFAADGASTSLATLPKGREAAQGLGVDPDFAVIWSGMPIQGPSEAQVGIVSDFSFDPRTGALSVLLADGGAIANSAYGVLSVPMDAIVGYAAGAVHITLTAVKLEASGGMAKAAAAAVVGAGQAVSAAGEAAGGAVTAASGAVGRAIKAARESRIPERAAHKAGKTWYDSVQAFREGMNGDD
jgi:hypothetical protein